MRGRTFLDVGQIAVDTDVDDGVAHVHLAGELDVRTVETLMDALEDIFERDVDSILIDGRDLAFIDSAGLRAIVIGLVRAGNAGIRYEVTDASDPFDRVLAITGLADALGR